MGFAAFFGSSLRGSGIGLVCHDFLVVYLGVSLARSYCRLDGLFGMVSYRARFFNLMAHIVLELSY